MGPGEALPSRVMPSGSCPSPGAGWAQAHHSRFLEERREVNRQVVSGSGSVSMRTLVPQRVTQSDRASGSQARILCLPGDFLQHAPWWLRCFTRLVYS